MDSMWPTMDLPMMQAGEEQNVIFVSSQNPSNLSRYAQLCLFVMDKSKIYDIFDPGQQHPDSICQFQTRRMDTKPGWGRGCNNKDVQKQNPDFLDNFKNLIGHFQKLESFSVYRKGKKVEEPAPAKVWKPKKRYSYHHMSTRDPPSYTVVLEFRGPNSGERPSGYLCFCKRTSFRKTTQ